MPAAPEDAAAVELLAALQAARPAAVTLLMAAAAAIFRKPLREIFSIIRFLSLLFLRALFQSGKNALPFLLKVSHLQPKKKKL